MKKFELCFARDYRYEYQTEAESDIEREHLFAEDDGYCRSEHGLKRQYNGGLRGGVYFWPMV